MASASSSTGTSTSRRMPSTRRLPSSPVPVPGPITSADALPACAEYLLQSPRSHEPFIVFGDAVDERLGERDVDGRGSALGGGEEHDAAPRSLCAAHDHHGGSRHAAGASDDEQGARRVLVGRLGGARYLAPQRGRVGPDQGRVHVCFRRDAYVHGDDLARQ